MIHDPIHPVEDLRIEATPQAGLWPRRVRQAVGIVVPDTFLDEGDAAFQLIDGEVIGPLGTQRAHFSAQRFLTITQILAAGEVVGRGGRQGILHGEEFLENHRKTAVRRVQGHAVSIWTTVRRSCGGVTR